MDPHTDSAPRWRSSTRIAFRFCVVYVGLYVVTTQMLSGLIVLPVGSLPEFGNLPPVRTLVFWVATHLFRISHTLVVTGSGSGDKTYDWVQTFCLLLIALVATAAWSGVDRHRASYETVHKWFRVFVRFALGSTVISYGFDKVIPLQMPAPTLTRLLEPWGNFSMMGVLWSSVGASFGYEIFVGFAEVIGGVLLFVPRITTLGALVCLGDTFYIFMLNMTYDVPVKLFSFHLILFSLLLLVPDASRLTNVLLGRAAGPSKEPPLVRGRRALRIALALQVIFGAYLVAMNLKGAREGWTTFGGGAPKSPLYGIWNVDEMSIDGQIRAPLVTDYDRWRRVAFQSPTGAAFQRMDETFAFYGARVNMSDRSLTLTRGNDKTWKASLSFQQPTPDRLIFDGTMGGRTVHMQLHMVDRNTFTLVNHSFHWIQEYPVNR
jgi:hypothetical protein